MVVWAGHLFRDREKENCYVVKIRNGDILYLPKNYPFNIGEYVISIANDKDIFENNYNDLVGGIMNSLFRTFNERESAYIENLKKYYD